MLAIPRRWLLSLTTFALLAALTTAPTQAQTANWEYSAELGGWLDWNTGLVWGEQVPWPEVRGSWSWTGAQNIYLPRYRLLSGNPAWRLPTANEALTASANGFAGVIGSPNANYSAWTSTTGPKSQVYYWIPASNIVKLSGTKSNYRVNPVYRAFTP